MKFIIRISIIFFLIFAQKNLIYSQRNSTYLILPKDRFLQNVTDVDIGVLNIRDIRVTPESVRFVVLREVDDSLYTIVPINRINIPSKIRPVLSSIANAYCTNSNICFISKHQMAVLSIKEIKQGSDYSYISLVHEAIGASVNQDAINFYYFEIKNNRLTIYYHLHNSNRLESANQILIAPCVSHWRDHWFPILKDSLRYMNFANSTIYIRLNGFIEDEPLDRFARNRSLCLYQNSAHYKKLPINDYFANSFMVEFNLLNQIELLFRNQIKLENDVSNFTIFNRSIYSNIINKYGNKNIEVRNNVFNFSLLIIKTQNFKPDSSNFTETMENEMIPSLQQIRNFCNSGIADQIKIDIIGYADRLGEGYPAWESKNRVLAINRANAVENWLREELRNIDNCRISINVMPCAPKEYQGTSRVVEIRVSDY